jgi:hypothetical protein
MCLMPIRTIFQLYRGQFLFTKNILAKYKNTKKKPIIKFKKKGQKNIQIYITKYRSFLMVYRSIS